MLLFIIQTNNFVSRIPNSSTNWIPFKLCNIYFWQRARAPLGDIALMNTGNYTNFKWIWSLDHSWYWMNVIQVTQDVSVLKHFNFMIISCTWIMIYGKSVSRFNWKLSQNRKHAHRKVAAQRNKRRYFNKRTF